MASRNSRAPERFLNQILPNLRRPRSARRGSRTRIDLSGMQRHRDQRRAAEHHIDADQQPDSPGGGARQACENDSGQDQVDDATRQHPAPSSRQLALVLEREHDRGNAFDHEKRDENHGKREDAARWPQQQYDTDRNSKDRRDERPPETRRLAHPEGGDQTDDSADEKEPAIQYFDCERGDGRNSAGGKTEEDENNTLA